MIRPHPNQILLGGGEHGHEPRPPRRNSLAEWARSIDRPMTIGELVALWWPEVGHPLAWVRDDGYVPLVYARQRAARARVRRLEAAGLVAVTLGPLVHRRQVGIVVVRVDLARDVG